MTSKGAAMGTVQFIEAQAWSGRKRHTTPASMPQFLTASSTSPHPYCATNDVTVSEFTLTVYFSPDSKSEPRGTTVSTRG